jgi:catechol 2,3-dioxygenase-like lactoylglutathione lyase family enzyme
MSVTGLSQVHVSVTDFDTAVGFYRDVLGLDFLFEVPEQSMAFFNLDGVRLYVGLAESPDYESSPLLYLTVDDLDSEYERLVAAGVDFVGGPHRVHGTDTYELWMAFFKTPDGHLHALTEERSTA